MLRGPQATPLYYTHSPRTRGPDYNQDSTTQHYPFIFLSRRVE